ncbi:MAG: glycosyltransferase [bacterium]|nr:glycosyltransferase [bacterium]
MSARPDVAVFLPGLEAGGAERALLLLARGLCDHLQAVDLVVARVSGDYVGLVPPSARLVDLSAPRARYQVGPLSRYLRRERPRALVTSLVDSSLVALAARRIAGGDTRLVLRLASTLSHQFGAWRLPGRLALRAVTAATYRFADVVVAVSRGAADDAARTLRIPRRRVHVIYGPHLPPNLDTLAAEPVGPDDGFEEGGDPVVLACGRLVPEKDLVTLIRAFASVPPPARLVLVGQGPERAALEALADDLGIASRVRFTGFAINPFRFMARCAVYAHSARYEGMPGSLVQAMALGCPVVATDCPHGPREILRDGELGTLVGVGDVDALSAALGRALRVPPEVGEARAHARRFSLPRVTGEYLDVLLPRDAGR